MLIKRFIGNTIQEALHQVKSELGEDAIILRTRQMRKYWWLGRFSSPLVEVTAATPDSGSGGDDPAVPSPAAVEDLWKKRSTALHWWEIKEEIGELKEQMRMLCEQVRSSDITSLAPALMPYCRGLMENGVLMKWAEDITSSLAYQHAGEVLHDPQQGKQILQEAVGAKILTRKIPLTSPGKPRVIALVGPTGVGKTTTLAKLVTSYRFWGRSRVALISADTYRVAALEQLKTFAAIAGLPVEAVYQPRAMKPALLRHQTKEAIFIDTAGR
ncbi:MAG: flagellar biosynthesis protein FlhF, partial [bacterium]